ncbi:helix-turn-helix transcriptional regulator [Rhizobium sp. NLR22b]|uniref:helix-turn-helix domain-containing protein n=1 Tax=Rhizobium sp. NLR22b TaxID=2731115 RepID=UPI001C830BCA|nr:helix-turn-helix transcriptional regulator [Rhizobium sp. NLR22b]MBX5238647.1 helix-turn-helix transcriptional regulator [Rhizobium sp. NLR22b]
MTSVETVRITPREKEILKLVAAGKTGWEMSTILALSEHTIRSHILSAKRKFDAMTIAHMVALAFRGKIIE